MPTPPVPQEELEIRKLAVEQALRDGFAPYRSFGGRGSSVEEAARRLGIDGGKITGPIAKGQISPDWSLYQEPPEAKARREAQQGWAPDHGLTHHVPDGLALKGTSIRYDKAGEVDQYWNKTRLAGRDAADTVALPDPKKITKLSTLYDQQGNVTQQWVSEKPEDAAREALWVAFAESLAEDLPKLPPRPTAPLDYSAELMNVIPFGDPHFGLYCWAAEVGQDFDLTIAKRDLCGAVDYLVSQAPLAKRCLIVNLGDFYHADNLEGTTTRSGHALDMDTRLPKVIRVGASAMRQAIETALTRHETVEVINAIGNHDTVLSMALSIMLSHIYENEPRVIVHDAPTRRHYVRHGRTLVGVTHGDLTKDRDLPGIMATERPEDWGLTKHRYFYRGHHHHDVRLEFNGCIVEQFRTLAAGDAYAVGNGYLSGRDMKMIVLHSEYGEVGRTTCSIDLLRSRQAAA